MDISIKGYDIEEKIGEGGMAEVFRARHVRLDRIVALKVLSSRLSEEPGFAERFVREARIAARLNHANIVQIYDVDHASGRLFLSMELVGGGDLSQKLSQKADREFAVSVFNQLCTALDYAHAKGYIHRDIKPANILFRDDESLALSDFGIAKAMRSDTNMTKTGLVIGTPSYMSPEQAQSHELDGRSDLYACGVIAFQFLTGQLPYNADSSISMAIKHISDPIPTLTPALGAMQNFFNQALAKKPDERFANGAAFVTAFADAVRKIDANSYEEHTTQILSTPGSGNTNTVMRSKAEEILSKPSPEVETRPRRTPPKQDRRDRRQANNAAARQPANHPPKSKSGSPVLWAMVGVVFAIGIAFASYQFVIAPKVDEPTIQQAVLSPGEQVRIGQLLTRADEAMAANRWVTPDGNNAYQYFVDIMALSPDDPIAVEGIQKVVDQLTLLGEEALARKDFEETQRLLAQLANIDAGSDRITALQQEVTIAWEQQVQEISVTLAAARQQLQEGDIKTALEGFKKAQAMPLTDTQQTAMYQSIEVEAIKALTDAKNASANNNFNQTYTQLDKAQQIAAALPNKTVSNQIEQLRRDTRNKQNQIAREQEQRERQEQRAEATQDLLRKADAAFAAGKLTSPEIDSAWYYYSQALQRDPNSREASAGQQNVKQTLVNTVNGAIDAGDTTLAATSIAQLERIDGKHPDLTGLRQRLAQKQRTVERNSTQKKRFDQLYARAQTYLERNRANGADNIYSDLVKLIPDDPRLPDLSRRIADGYVFLAQREIDANDWKDVDVWVSRGLIHVPDHPRLLEQRAFAQEKIDQGCTSLLNFRC